MNQAKLSLFLSLSLNIFYLNAMEDSESGSEMIVLNSKYVDPVQIISFFRTQTAMRAAANCDLDTLKKNVDESNVNIVTVGGCSLLNLACKSGGHPNFKEVADFLLSKGAHADKRARYEYFSPLVESVINAIKNNKIEPLEYFLEKDFVNPFLRNQTEAGNSAAFSAVGSLVGELDNQQKANRTKVVKLFTARAKSLAQALETLDLLTIKKFANPETVNDIAEDLTPLLRVASTCGRALVDERKAIFQELFKHSASPNKFGILDNKKTVPLQCITIGSIKTGDTSLIPIFLEQGANPLLDPENEGNNSSYDIAKDFQTNFPEICKKCNKSTCQASKIRAHATEIVQLFDAHLAKQRALNR